ncbi:MAG: hypothetical protein ABL925_01815 [Methylococcales bacterium]
MHLSIAGILICAAGWPLTAHTAEIIVNTSVPVKQYSLLDVRAIFAMQQRFWPNGERIKVFTLADADPVHKDFVKKNLDMFPHQLRRVWDRMIFSGTGEAPVQIASQAEMVEKIAGTPNSIGYLDSGPKHEKIRVFEYH